MMINAVSESLHNSKNTLKHIDQVFHFLVHDVNYCLVLDQVIRVLPLVAMKTIPDGPNHLVGILNLHGIYIPIIDLAILIGQRKISPYTPDTSIILCHDGRKLMGLVANKIIGIEVVDPTKIQTHTDYRDSDSPFLAVINYMQTTSLLVDPHCITSLEPINNVAGDDDAIELFIAFDNQD